MRYGASDPFDGAPWDTDDAGAAQEAVGGAIAAISVILTIAAILIVIVALVVLVFDPPNPFGS